VKTLHSRYGKLWIGIGILILLAPIGLILPELFKASGAWGEWGADEIKDIAGYLPEGLKRISGLWSAPIPDYAFTGWDKGVKSYIAYIVSGVIGAVIAVAVSYLLGKFLKRGNNGRTR
jgi:uncharacterized membrane protein YeaQ/YmgE (transglycosylase-associated protein family)